MFPSGAHWVAHFPSLQAVFCPQRYSICGTDNELLHGSAPNMCSGKLAWAVPTVEARVLCSIHVLGDNLALMFLLSDAHALVGGACLQRFRTVPYVATVSGRPTSWLELCAVTASDCVLVWPLANLYGWHSATLLWQCVFRRV